MILRLVKKSWVWREYLNPKNRRICMPHREHVRRLIAPIRAKRGAREPILHNQRGVLAQEDILPIIKAWEKKKGFTPQSADELMKGIHTTAVATRISLKRLMHSIDGARASTETKKLLSQLILNRPTQRIPHTNILLRPHRSIIYLKLINLIGEEKTAELCQQILDEAVKIKHESAQLWRQTNSDAFQNVPQRAPADYFLFTNPQKNRSNFTNRVYDFIENREAGIRELEHLPKTKENKHFIKLLKTQKEEAINELSKLLLRSPRTH
jgi:hypothetical protein